MQWDLCVFGKGRGKKRARDGERAAIIEDKSGRPQEKIPLFSGPTGLGKTTLAEIVWTGRTGRIPLSISFTIARVTLASSDLHFTSRCPDWTSIPSHGPQENETPYLV